MKASTTTGLIGLLIFFYLFSLPLVAKILEVMRWQVSGSLQETIIFIYSPCLALYTHFPPYKSILDLELKMLGLL